MSETTTPDQADEALRALLAGVDPEAGADLLAPTHLLDRVRADMAGEPHDDVPAGSRRDHGTAGRPRLVRRRWEAGLLVAAGACTLALAAGSVVPGLLAGTAANTSPESAASAPGVSGSGVGTDAVGRPSVGEADSSGGKAAPGAAAPSAGAAVEQRLVRSGSVLAGTEDQAAARDRFVAAILAMGGRVMSESVVTEGSSTYSADTGVASDAMRTSYPYPWYPTGPGIWLVVQVPAQSYDKAIQAARAAGEVVQMQQSSYDVGTQIADTDARIKALEASLARLTALMDQAKSVSDVIALEQAISARQSELDALRAQQRDLANQTAMSQVSLTLMSPQDARQSVDPQPQQTWWESFVEGLSQMWTWLGQALLILSPLLLAAGVIALVRRRSRRRSPGTPAGTAPEPGAAATAEPR